MENLKDLLVNSVNNYGACDAFVFKDNEGNHKHISYIRFYEEIRCVVEALIERGHLGKRVAIIGNNSLSLIHI